jgi:gamma-glutamyl hydrolase
MIGIIDAPNIKRELSCGKSYLFMAYIHWIEMSGETVVIIPYNIKEQKLLEILARVNGVVWVGGEIENKKTHTTQQYNDLVNTLFTTYQYAISENNKGNYYPIWSTCLGMDMLIMFVKEEESNIVKSMKPYSKNGVYSCVFTKESSRLKKWFSAYLQHEMKKQPCVYHNHNYGNDTIPEDKVRVVSMQDGYINILEFIDYPFYGVQFHPEQPHNDFSIKVSEQFSLFFKQECSKNKNKWKWKLSDFKNSKITL